MRLKMKMDDVLGEWNCSQAFVGDWPALGDLLRVIVDGLSKEDSRSHPVLRSLLNSYRHKVRLPDASEEDSIVRGLRSAQSESKT